MTKIRHPRERAMLTVVDYPATESPPRRPCWPPGQIDRRATPRCPHQCGTNTVQHCGRVPSQSGHSAQRAVRLLSPPRRLARWRKIGSDSSVAVHQHRGRTSADYLFSTVPAEVADSSTRRPQPASRAGDRSRHPNSTRYAATDSAVAKWVPRPRPRSAATAARQVPLLLSKSRRHHCVPVGGLLSTVLLMLSLRQCGADGVGSETPASQQSVPSIHFFTVRGIELAFAPQQRHCTG